MRRLLLAATALLALATPSFAQQTRAQMGASNDTSFFACGVNCISPSTLHAYFALQNSAFGFINDADTWLAAQVFSSTATFNGAATFTGAVTLPQTVIPGLSLLPHAANLTALKAWSTTVSPVFRDGYAAIGDAGDSLLYSYSPSACSISGGDNGWQVAANSGGCWTASLPSSGADVRIWGAVGGVNATDASAAFLAAANAASSGQAGGKVLIPATYFKVAQSANLDFSPYPNISIGCEAGSFGIPNVSNLTAPCTLQVNPSYTIDISSNQELYGVRIVNINYDYPVNARGSLTQAAGFSGTGLTIPGTDSTHYSHDVTIHDVTINGFAQGFHSTWSQRLTAYHIEGDDTNGLWVDNCIDTCNFHEMTWKALMNKGLPQTYNVSSATYSGGVTSIVLSAGGTVPLVNGDTIVLYGFGGMSSLRGRYTITSLTDSTHFTVTGGSGAYATYSKSVTTNGTVYVSVTDSTNLAVGMSAINATDAVNGYLITAISAPTGPATVTLNKATTGTGASETMVFGAGQVYLPTSTRQGIAYNFTGANVGGEALWALWELGHDICFQEGPSHGPDEPHYLWCDGDAANGTLADNGAGSAVGGLIGANVLGYGGGLFGGVIVNKANSVVVNTSDSLARPFTITSNDNVTAAGCASTLSTTPGAAVNIVSGAVSLVNSYIRGNCANNYAAINVASGQGPLLISNTQMAGFSINFATAADAANSKLDGQIMSTLTAPTVSSGFCTSPSIQNFTTTAAFQITIGSACGASTGALTMPPAPHGWTCTFSDVTNPAGNLPRMSGAGSTTSVPVTNYNAAGAATNWTASDIINALCRPY